MARHVIGLAALLAFPLFLQDPADPVKALVEKLGSDEIAVREQAQAELLKLGPAALPAIREQLGRATPERKNLLLALVARIEENQGIAKLLEPGRLLSINVKDKPIAEVLAELQSQSGVPVEGFNLPEGTRVSLAVDGVTLAAAVDQLCLAHGRLMYVWGPDEVTLWSAPYRKLPAFDKGPFRFIVDRFERCTAPEAAGQDERFSLVGALLGPPGRFPVSATVVPDSPEDDLGTRLAEGSGGSHGVNDEIEPDSLNPAERGPRVREQIYWNALTIPSPDAQRIKSFRGRLNMTFASGHKRILSIKSPFSEPTGAATDRATTLELLSWKREGDRVTIEWRVTRRSNETEAQLRLRQKHSRIVLHEAGGRRFEGWVGRYQWPGVESKAEFRRLELAESSVFEIAKDVQIATLDLVDPEYQEISIPFDLGEVPLR